MLYLGIDIGKNNHVASMSDENGDRHGSYRSLLAGHDIIDSILIADLIRYGDFVETSLADENTMSLRNLSRFRNYLVSSISDLKRKVICVLDSGISRVCVRIFQYFRPNIQETAASFSNSGGL